MNKYLVIKETGEISLNEQRINEDIYEFLKRVVQGRIELVSWIPIFSDIGVDLWVNDEGKMNNSLPNIAIFHDNKLIEMIYGNVCFARYDDDGNTIPLKGSDIKYIKKLFSNFALLKCGKKQKLVYVLHV